MINQKKKENLILEHKLKEQDSTLINQKIVDPNELIVA